MGSVLVPLLLRERHHVVVVDNFLYGQASLLDVCHERLLTVVRGDVRDTALMALCTERADVVIPLACITGAPACVRDEIAARTVNLDAVRALSMLTSTQQFILFPSTNSGYGTGGLDVPCTEESPLQPLSVYGRLKVEAEQVLADARPNTTVFRFATAFGASPRMRLDLLVNDFVYRAVVDRYVVLYEPDFMRNYVHVRDMARAFLHGLNHLHRTAGQTYNVGLDGADCSKRELCVKIREHVPEFQVFEAPVGQDPDQRNYRVSSKKIRDAGFSTRWSLDDGIRELLAAYRIVRRGQFVNAA